MAFDQTTRNRLARFVSESRALLAEEFTRQLQHEYGLDPANGEMTDLEKLTALDDARRETARILRETLDYYLTTLTPGPSPRPGRGEQDALERILREQAFTVLNRLCALRMAEARGLILEAVAQGYRSKGFQLYARLAGSALGETGAAYRIYLFSLFDELALELPPLFDRFSPQGRLFPRESALLKLLDLLDAPDLETLWVEDETIGWIYQYFNSKEERQAMRAASQAPRNSRELAVRNQFFTPRYVVEFLTDNTLGRIWYEMTGSETALKESCRYLVRRPCEVFLGYPTFDYDRLAPAWVGAVVDHGNFTMLPADPSLDDLGWLARLIDEETIAAAQGYSDLKLLSERCVADLRTGKAPPSDPLTLWLILSAFHTGLVGYGFDTISETSDPIRPYAYRVYAALRQALLEPHTDLSQEELLRQPVFIPHRPLKDPRDILMLDPACGSMHFGLYAFDLYEIIYAEAWGIEEQGGMDKFLRSPGLRPLHESYPDKEAFLQEVPRLIIEHNIHGIDIDPRAVQIAGLSLWLRAQKSWQAQGLRSGERPQIRKSNIVCAEPMPGDQMMLEEFLATLREERLETLMRKALPAGKKLRITPSMVNALAELVRTVWQEMELAGEAGSLLKIDETLREAIAVARKQTEEKAPLFRVLEFGLNELNKEHNGQSSAEEEYGFWNQAEALVLAALREYAEQAENGGGYKRRLFAGDAGQGFSFIDLCRKRYDLVLMNPPFGDSAKGCKIYTEQNFIYSSSDIFQAFVERGIYWLIQAGRVGVISARTGFFLGDSKEWRANIVFKKRVVGFADLGLGVLDDALVEVAAYIIENNNPANNRIYTNRQLDSRDKEQRFLASVEATGRGVSGGFQPFDQSLIEIIPDYTFAYWAPASLIRRYSDASRFGQVVGRVRQGIATGDDFRFARLGWEVSHGTIGAGKRWQRFSKGGEYSPPYDDIHLLIDWWKDGSQLKASPSARFQNIERMFLPGATYTVRTASAFTGKVLPKGCIFSHNAQTWFAASIDVTLLSIGFLSCRVPQTFLELAVGSGDIATAGSAARRYTTAVVESVPSAPLFEIDNIESLTAIQELYRFRLNNFLMDETSCHFCKFTLSSSARTLKDETHSRNRLFLEHFSQAMRASAQLDNAVSEAFHLTDMERTFTEMEIGVHPVSYAEIANEIDVIRLYHLPEEKIIAEAIAKHGSKRWFTKKSYFVDRKLEIISHHLQTAPENIVRILLNTPDIFGLEEVAKQIISEILGSIFGRWDLSYATGEKLALELSDPFASLPVCPPGMLQNNMGLPATPQDIPVDYPLRITWGGIVVDDPGHPEDVAGRAREALQVIWNERAEAIEQEACQILGVRSLEEYFRKPGLFFAEHLKRYSKSRRQAPIYWPLATPSSSYTLWLYYHRLSDQTLFTCVNDFVDPKLKQVGDDLGRLRRKTGRSAADEKELERLTDLERELKDLRSELLRVAAFWKPDLNDGVEITAAPLWKLFQHKPWQKRLKETWGKLESGEYDWAHLAYSIWPERVREKCKTDKSLAIAHGLEEVYVEEDGKKKKKGAVGQKEMGLFEE